MGNNLHQGNDWGTQRTGVGPSRRDFLWAAAGVGTFSLFGSLRQLLARETPDSLASAKSVILVWLNGGPSHLDTFDPKTESSVRGEFGSIPTTIPGVRFSEHLPKLARLTGDLAIVRSMVSAEGNHDRARYLMHTGYSPQGTITHPCFGSIVASEIGDPGFDLPNFISIRFPSLGASFLGPQFSPFFIQDPTREIANLGYADGVRPGQFDRRFKLMTELEANFAKSRIRPEVDSHREVYQKALKLVKSPMVEAFDLSRESDSLRERYGNNPFGQGCLMARRLAEKGVRFVEVALDGWDTHRDNFNRTKDLMAQLDPALSALLSDMKSRGLLAQTLVVCMGEFGRTPRINSNTGRDHFPAAWSFLLAGGGVRGGHVIGATDPKGASVTRGKVTPPDLFASLCSALGIDPEKQNYSGRGRPVKLVNKGKVIPDLFG